MSKEITTQKANTIQALVNSPNIKEKFKEILGKKSAGFVASILQVVSNNEMLKNAEPMSIIRAASIAATLDLPINQNLGFAYIIPYRGKDGVQVAQFQVGYRGFIQLAQRTGQYKTISASPIYEGQIVSENPLLGYEFDFTKKTGEKVIGFAAYFSLINGFEKTLYMTVEQLKAHGVKYSQTARKGFGLWVDNFEAMAQKTVLKLLLSKFAPLSTEMQTATLTDQSVIKNADTFDVEYVDHERDTKVVDLKSADLTTGLKIKGEKKQIEEKVEEPEETPETEENDENEATDENSEQETDQGETKTEPAEPLEGEFQCTKCKDISTLTLDGPQVCQVCGAQEWKPIGEAGKKMAKGMKKAKK